MLGDTAVMVHPEDERYKPPDRQDGEAAAGATEIPIIADTTSTSNSAPAASRSPGARLQRLRGRPAPQPADHPRSGRWTRSVQRPRAVGAIPRPGPLRRAQRPSSPTSKAWACWKTDKHKLKVPRGDRTGVVIEADADRPVVRRHEQTGQGRQTHHREGARRGFRRDQFVPRTGSTPTTSGSTTSRTGASRASSGGPPDPGLVWRDGVDLPSPTTAKKPSPRRRTATPAADAATDVLDTWYSSALWPFSTLDWTPGGRPSRTRRSTSCRRRCWSPASTSSSSGSREW